MYESEKGFLERIADKIPGVRGYREKESRRDTDKRLREHLSAEIDRQRKALDGLKRDQLGSGKLGALDDIDRVARKLQKAADQLRFASYGYSGFFDKVKVGEAELDRIYRYDEGLLGQVRALEAAVAGAGAASEVGGAVSDLEKTVDALDAAIEGRKQIFNAPE